ncbi:MAG TPA: aminomethyl-transferring glycine dehydrogenase subunit GcvPA [Deinococcales bacterium]|nr:aminomethyl-transferring glycine dehydrogenase subunit GcvPA [Deinococcales bacterium]
MRYTPHTPQDVERALETIGAGSIDDLFADLPQGIRDPEIDIPAGLDEVGLVQHMRGLAERNRPSGPDFLGGGVVRHFIPAVADALTFQSDFVTAYTPYQPEVSQGLLQGMFEYQSMLAELTGLDASNSSLYDGSTAVAEAALLALRQTNRMRVLVSRGVHPEHRETLATFLGAVGATMQTADLDGTTSPAGEVSGDIGAVIVQNPNYLGSLEDLASHAAAAHAAGALLIAVVDPASLAVLKSPGEAGADVAVGDGQTIGNAPNYGGPTFGFIVVKDALVRQLPGRLVGATRDVDGRRGFVLTLQAREQHIRRAKAKSNICSNHALMALQAAIYLAALGPAGLREAATVSALRARELEAALARCGLPREGAARYFREFAVRLPLPAAEFRARLAARGIHAAVPVPGEYGLGDAALFAASELTTPADIVALEAALKEVLA